jgi:uncharacterized protein (TIGR03066 family)
MRLLGCVVVVCALLTLLGRGLGTRASAEEKATDKSTKEKLLGTWEVTKSKELPPGSTLEFRKDGKLKMTFTAGNKTQSVEMDYAVEKEAIKVTIEVNGKKASDVNKIKTLTDTKLVTQDSKGNVDEFKKKK